MATWPNRIDYRLPETAASEVEALADNAANLSQFVECAHKQDVKTELQEIIDLISSEHSMPSSEMRKVFNALENVRELSTDLGSLELGLNRVIKAVDQTIAAKVEKNKTAILAALKAYGYDNPVTLTIKSQRLTYSRERLFYDAEILTDARPVFDKSGAKILQFIITHDLALTSMVDGQIRQEHISLDHADVATLRDACIRAILKANTLRDVLGKTAAPTVIVRDEAVPNR